MRKRRELTRAEQITTLQPNPFSYPRAQWLPYGARQVAEEYVPTWWGPRFLQSTVSVVVGGRGSGKTMLLLFATAPVQAWVQLRASGAESWSSKLRAKFLSEASFLGVHLYTDAARMRGLPAISEGRSESAESQLLFGHYLNCYASSKILETFVELQTLGAINLGTRALRALKDVVAAHLGPIDGPYQSTLEGLHATVRALRIETERHLNQPADRRKVLPRGYSVLGQPLRDICDVLASGPLAGRSVALMFDEYENFTSAQQRLVNGLVKAAARPMLVKLAMRPHDWNQETLNADEPLRRVHDYDEIDIEENLFAAPELRRRDQFLDLASGIARRRLEGHRYFAKAGKSDWAAFLPPVGDSDFEAAEALKRRESRAHLVTDDLRHAINEVVDMDEVSRAITLDELLARERPLLTLLNAVLVRRDPSAGAVHRIRSQFLEYQAGARNTAYAELYDKNHIALLYRLLHLLHVRKVYAGFELVVMLASGIVRNFLELSYQLYEVGAAAGYVFDGAPIPPEVQTSGVEKAADVLLRDAAADRRHGRSVRSLAEAVGNLFQSLHVEDDRIREPELSHFTVDYRALDRPAQDVLDAAVGLSVLQQKEPMLDKRNEVVRSNDYVLSRTLVPRYRISHRVRGVVRLEPDELSGMIAAQTDADVKQAVNNAKRRILKGGRSPTRPKSRSSQEKLPYDR